MLQLVEFTGTDTGHRHAIMLELMEFVMGDQFKRNHSCDIIVKLSDVRSGTRGRHAVGFTLIEVLVATVILSVCLLALGGLMVTTTKTNSFGNHLTEASVFGQGKLEELRAMGWEKIKEGIETDEVSGSTGINYIRKWSVDTKGSLKTITVSINWKDPIDHSIKFVSILSQ